MKLKIFFLSIVLIFSSSFVFSYSPGFEFGVGSGYVHYGDKETRDRNSDLGGNQIVLTADARILFPVVQEKLYLTFGGDSTFDGRWNGGEHIFLVDYSFLLGFRAYPIWGFVCSVDYALGRRTDFIDIDDYDDDVDSTEWGNGFRFGLGYDFSFHTKGFAPMLGAAWKSMPRGGSRDNLITVFLKFGNRRP